MDPQHQHVNSYGTTATATRRRHPSQPHMEQHSNFINEGRIGLDSDVDNPFRGSSGNPMGLGRDYFHGMSKRRSPSSVGWYRASRALLLGIGVLVCSVGFLSVRSVQKLRAAGRQQQAMVASQSLTGREMMMQQSVLQSAAQGAQAMGDGLQLGMQAVQPMGMNGMQAGQPMGMNGMEAGQPMGTNGMQVGQPMGTNGMQAGQPMGMNGMEAGQPMGTNGIQAGQPMEMNGMQAGGISNGQPMGTNVMQAGGMSTGHLMGTNGMQAGRPMGTNGLQVRQSEVSSGFQGTQVMGALGKMQEGKMETGTQPIVGEGVVTRKVMEEPYGTSARQSAKTGLSLQQGTMEQPGTINKGMKSTNLFGEGTIMQQGMTFPSGKEVIKEVGEVIEGVTEEVVESVLFEATQTDNMALTNAKTKNDLRTGNKNIKYHRRPIPRGKAKKNIPKATTGPGDPPPDKVDSVVDNDELNAKPHPGPHHKKIDTEDIVKEEVVDSSTSEPASDSSNADTQRNTKERIADVTGPLQDQMFMVSTVAGIALVVGAISARKVRSKPFLSDCIENESLEDDLAYDTENTFGGVGQYGSFSAPWRGDLEKFDV